MLSIKLQLTSWDCRPSFTYIFQGLELESPKHRVVKIPVPGPFLHLNASPAAGPCLHSWGRRTTQGGASERKFQSRGSWKHLLRKRQRFILSSFHLFPHPNKNHCQKLQLNCARLGDCRRNFSPACSPHRARAVFPELRTPVICWGRGGCSEWGAAVSKLCPEPQLSWRASDAPQTGLLLRARVSEC